MKTDRLLWLAERLCGADARLRVFEPLVADWAREVHDAVGGARRARARVFGATAFIVTLAICSNPFDGPHGKPARGFLIAVSIFALAATVIQLAPFGFLSSPHTAVLWQQYEFRPDQLRYSPHYFAVGLGFALLPAAMMSSSRITNWHFLFAMILPLLLALALRGVETEDAAGTIGRIGRHQQAAFSVLTIALALLGHAIARARGETPPLAAVTGWWLFGWMGYQLLQFWANRLRVVAPAPIEIAIWLPPLTLLSVAAVANVAAKAPAERESPDS